MSDEHECDHHDPEMMKAQLELVQNCVEALGQVINSIHFDDDADADAEELTRVRMHNAMMGMLVACRSIGSGLGMSDEQFAEHCASAITFAENHVVTARLQEVKVH